MKSNKSGPAETLVRQYTEVLMKETFTENLPVKVEFINLPNEKREIAIGTSQTVFVNLLHARRLILRFTLTLQRDEDGWRIVHLTSNHFHKSGRIDQKSITRRVLDIRPTSISLGTVIKKVIRGTVWRVIDEATLSVQYANGVRIITIPNGLPYKAKPNNMGRPTRGYTRVYPKDEIFYRGPSQDGQYEFVDLA